MIISEIMKNVWKILRLQMIFFKFHNFQLFPMLISHVIADSFFEKQTLKYVKRRKGAWKIGWWVDSEGGGGGLGG